MCQEYILVEGLMEYDVFISHASENKSEVALPLANLLRANGIKVWIDAFELKLGDSLRRSIDRGLSMSRYGVVILSPEFLKKEWPQRELDGLAARETGIGKVILPVWHNITHDEIIEYSPILADRLGVSTTHGLQYVAQQVLQVIREESFHPPLVAPPPSSTFKPDLQLPKTPVKGILDEPGRYIFVSLSSLLVLLFISLFVSYFLPDNHFIIKAIKDTNRTISSVVVYGILFLLQGMFWGYIWQEGKWRWGLVLSLFPFIMFLMIASDGKNEPGYFMSILGLTISTPVCASIGSLLGAFFSRRIAT
jgi:hypothetical protein